MIDFQEWLVKATTNTKLFEMAYERKKAEAEVSGLADPIMLHIIKVLYFEDKINHSKHIKDINNWLKKIQQIRLKPNGSNVKERDYYQWLFSEPYDGLETLEYILDIRLDDYASLKTLLPREMLNEQLFEIYARLSEDLSKTKFKTIEDYL